MTIVPLYRYTRPDGGVTVTPNVPEGAEANRVRLIADEGKLLIYSGATYGSCADTEKAEGWSEIDDPDFEKVGE